MNTPEIVAKYASHIDKELTLSEERNKENILLGISALKVSPGYLEEMSIKSKHSGFRGSVVERRLCRKLDLDLPGPKNIPDLYGKFELKVVSGKGGKITFGDWIPDLTFLVGKWWNRDDEKVKFCKQYGFFNVDRKRWSWACPIRYGFVNRLGQSLKITEDGVFVVCGEVMVLGWSHELLQKRVENKFGKCGLILCDDELGVTFGKVILYGRFLEGLRCGDIFFDPGTCEGNRRGYMLWRGKKGWFG